MKAVLNICLIILISFFGGSYVEPPALFYRTLSNFNQKTSPEIYYLLSKTPDLFIENLAKDTFSYGLILHEAYHVYSSSQSALRDFTLKGNLRYYYLNDSNQIVLFANKSTFLSTAYHICPK